MKLRVGLDFHSVISDDSRLWLKMLSDNDATCSHREGWQSELVNGYAPTWDFIHEVCQPCFRSMLITPEVQLAAATMPGSPRGIRRLAEFCDLYLISSGNQGDAIRQWLRWRRLELCFQGMFFKQVSKVELMNKLSLHFHVDDAPYNIEAILKTMTVPIVFDMPYNRHLTGILRVRGWTELVTMLTGEFHERQSRAA